MSDTQKPKTPQVKALPGMTPLGMTDGPTDPPDHDESTPCGEFVSPPADVENGPSPDDLVCADCGFDLQDHVAPDDDAPDTDSPAADGERAAIEDNRRDLLTVDSVVVSRIDTDIEVAWIAHFMIGDDWIFEAFAYGDGRVDFSTHTDDDPDERVLYAFGHRDLLIDHVRAMAEASIVARHTDGRYFINSPEAWYAETPANAGLVNDVSFGIAGPADMKVRWIDLGLSGPAPRLEAFDDSFPMFAKLAEVFIDLGQVPSLPPSYTRPQFIAFLKSHGFEDRTEREVTS